MTDDKLTDEELQAIEAANIALRYGVKGKLTISTDVTDAQAKAVGEILNAAPRLLADLRAARAERDTLLRAHDYVEAARMSAAVEWERIMDAAKRTDEAEAEAARLRAVVEAVRKVRAFIGTVEGNDSMAVVMRRVARDLDAALAPATEAS